MHIEFFFHNPTRQKYEKKNYLPASEARRQVANLTERKKILYAVSKICVSVLSDINFEINYLTTGKTEWAENSARTSEVKMFYIKGDGSCNLT